jgi:DNA-binding transcriptional LysR family regulator
VDLRSLRYAITLAEELHFGRSARREFISAQSFGASIKRLEHHVGFAIFHRSSRRVSLTPRGVAFVARARVVLDELDELRLGPSTELEASGHQELVIGTLGFGLAELWAPVWDVFRTTAPHVRLRHRDLDLVTQHQMVQSGAVDAGIVFDLGPVDGLRIDDVYFASRVAVVPAWSELAQLDVVSASDLADVEWIGMSPVDGMLGWLGPAADACRPSGVTRPDSIANAVAVTGGVGLHAAPAARYYPRPDVTYVPAEGPGCSIAIATREDDDRAEVAALRAAVTAALALAAPGADRTDVG